jgi:hypothetical protein
MSSTTKPTVVAFPGALHEASCMDAFVRSLQSAGFPAEAHTLPTRGNVGKVLAEDEEKMRSAMKKHIDAGKQVVLIVHSFAGFPGCGAVSGLDTKTRQARGETGGVLGVIYLSAFIPREGCTMIDVAYEPEDPWSAPNMESGMLELTKDLEYMKNIFYNDCSDEVAEAAIKTLKPHSLGAFASPPCAMGIKEDGFNGRRAYIKCLKDNALPPSAQNTLLESSGVDWIIREMDTSHSPFLSVPDETVKVVEGLVKEFETAA